MHYVTGSCVLYLQRCHHKHWDFADLEHAILELNGVMGEPWNLHVEYKPYGEWAAPSRYNHIRSLFSLSLIIDPVRSDILSKFLQLALTLFSLFDPDGLHDVYTSFVNMK